MFDERFKARTVTVLADACGNVLNRKFDTVIMNPPFGTKNNEGIDCELLVIAFRLSKNVVYSLHKSSTADVIL